MCLNTTKQLMEQVLQDFSDIGVHLNPDWLAGLEILNDGPLTDDDVYMTLVCSDVRESCISPPTSPLLPHALRIKTRFPQGSFFFQVTSAIDISLPDMQRPRVAGSNGKRMLKLSLHSGPGIHMHAVELEPIPHLIDMPEAGMKIIITGSPSLSKGVLLLKPENVKLVGGEVGHLTSQQQSDLRHRLAGKDPLVYRASSRSH